MQIDNIHMTYVYVNSILVFLKHFYYTLEDCKNCINQLHYRKIPMSRNTSNHQTDKNDLRMSRASLITRIGIGIFVFD